MKRTILAFSMFFMGLGIVAIAADEKAKTFEGTLVCAKCTLKETKTCRPCPQGQGRRQGSGLLREATWARKKTYHKGHLPGRFAEAEVPKSPASSKKRTARRRSTDCKVEIEEVSCARTQPSDAAPIGAALTFPRSSFLLHSILGRRVRAQITIYNMTP